MQFPGFSATWLIDFSATWLIDFSATWLIDFSATWLIDFSATWLIDILESNQSCAGRGKLHKKTTRIKGPKLSLFCVDGQ
jgi:hypothetical protein